MTAETEILSWPGMLLVGGAGRNSGKTRFSCSLIERFCERQDVVGLKVTVIREAGPCPRGSDGCGVCSSLSGKDFEITEERGELPGKDTSLMVQSGARPVYWMRVMHEHLAEGTAALIERVGADTRCICESNSLRHAVEPGVFVIVKERCSDKYKRSAREVLELADRVVLSDAEGFDVSVDDFVFSAGRWTLRSGGTTPPQPGSRR